MRLKQVRCHFRGSFGYLLTALLVISSSTGIQAQQQTQPKENRFVVPPDVTFLLIASQPGSPIGFKDCINSLNVLQH
ncbi:MAG TPA: hypothetical protein VK582_14960 [Pyrinomonadaceae bacterium]|nr:hypothetical protein [Pyrinomonadaceae bacterium]